MVLKSVPRIHKGEEKVLVLVFWLGGWFFFWLVGFLKQQQKNPGHTVIASYLSHFLVCWVVLCKHAALK